MPHTAHTVIAPADLKSGTLNEWIAAIERFDQAGWPLAIVGNCDAVDPLDGLAMAAFCAARTSQIGLCASIDPANVEPFTLARGLVTLDYMSKGRAAWRAYPSADDARTLELIETVRELMASWDEDAILEDRENGLLSDADKVRAIDHEGAYFAVEGPLNLPQPPQGRVPLIAFAEEGRIAQAADLVLNPKTVWQPCLADLPIEPAKVLVAAEHPFLTRIETA